MTKDQSTTSTGGSSPTTKKKTPQQAAKNSPAQGTSAKSPTSGRPDTARTLVPRKSREGWWFLDEEKSGERYGHYTSERKARGALIAYNAKHGIEQGIDQLISDEKARHKRIMEM